MTLSHNFRAVSFRCTIGGETSPGDYQSHFQSLAKAASIVAN